MSTNPQKARAELSKQAKEEMLKQNLQRIEREKEVELARNLRSEERQAEIEKRHSKEKINLQTQTPKKKNGIWGIFK